MDTPAGLLQSAHQTLQGLFGLGPPQGAPALPPAESAQGLRAYQVFETAAGTACLEVHDAPDGGPLEIWVGVPRTGLTGIAASLTCDWFRYRRTADGTIVPDGGPLQICPPYGPWPTPEGSPPPQPLIADDGHWAHGERYLIKQVLFAGTDPPHWSPILVLTDAPEPFIGRIHALMQDPATRDAAVDLLQQAQPPPDVQLTVRVMNNWQPATARGFATRSSFTENDFALDHATGFNRAVKSALGVETPIGTLLQGDVTDPDFPGLDWHIDLRADPDTLYLASPGQPDGLAAEIEHFTLPVEYRPALGEWVQMVGRWVIDTGHVEEGLTPANGFRTEFHPEELLVSSRPDASHALGTLARVATTGAWQGLPLTFVVNPPARPAPDARLCWAITDEWRQQATLTITPWPANANHLIGTITTDDPTPLLIHPNGMVGMTDTRGYHALITCWWDVPTTHVSGQVLHGTDPAVGSYVFYAPAAETPVTWWHLAVDTTGAYDIPALLPGTYLFRPAGTAWDFADVPRRVAISGDQQDLDFSATPAEALAGPPGALESYPLHREESHNWDTLLRPDTRALLGGDHPVLLRSWVFDPGVLHSADGAGDAPDELSAEQITQLSVSPRLGLGLIPRQVAEPITDADDLAVATALADALLTLRGPAGPFGVRGNGLGYLEGWRCYVHLTRLDDSAGQPLLDGSRTLSRVRLEEVDSSGQPWITQDVVQIHGMRGPGVAGAAVRMRLWTADTTGTARIVAEATGETDANGTARFDLTPGTHMAEIVITVEALTNPGNPWLLPRTRTRTYLFNPGLTGDDSGAPQPYTLLPATASEAETGSEAKQEAGLARVVIRRLVTQAAVRELAPAAREQSRGLFGPGPRLVAPPPVPADSPRDFTQIDTVTRSTFPRPALP